MVLIVIMLCSLLMWILLTFWRERWLTIGLSLKVSTILRCSPVCPDVFSLTFGFLSGLCSLHTPEQHICNGFAFLACGLLLDPFGRRRYVLRVESSLILPALTLASVLHSAKWLVDSQHCSFLKFL